MAILLDVLRCFVSVFLAILITGGYAVYDVLHNGANWPSPLRFAVSLILTTLVIALAQIWLRRECRDRRP